MATRACNEAATTPLWGALTDTQAMCRMCCVMCVMCGTRFLGLLSNYLVVAYFLPHMEGSAPFWMFVLSALAIGASRLPFGTPCVCGLMGCTRVVFAAR